VRAASFSDRLLGDLSDEIHIEDVACAGDVDGDGHRDLLVGSAHRDRDEEVDVGAALLVHGPIRGSAPLDDAAVLWGGAAGDRLGAHLSGLGDLDLDGLDDFAVGSPNADLGAEDAGLVHVFLGEGL